MDARPLTCPTPPALLIVGHGTRSLTGQAEFRDTVALVARKLPDVLVMGCFLEMVEPTLATAIQRLAQRGVRQVVAVPLLLFEAGHAKRDVPSQVGRAAEQYRLRVHVTPALKDHPQLVALSVQRFREAAHRADRDPREVAWLLVGRGSLDEEATAQFHGFFARRQALTPVGAPRAAFLTMARPRVEDVMQELAALPLNWVIVQPHLLFAGDLLERLRRMVEGQDPWRQRQQWLMTRHIGCDERVAAVVVDRFEQAITVCERPCPPP